VNIPRLVIAGTSSGVGKTTIAVGLIAALKEIGLRVQPFKCGPDYIDPSYLTLAAGQPCHNLDSWMLPAESMVELFVHASERSNMAVVEGVMGLYDGRIGLGNNGSTAEIARILQIPVILVVDVARMSESAAAVVLGYRQMNSEVNIAGVILNNIGSSSHLRSTTEAIEKRTGVPVLGYLLKTESLSFSERHLGLVPAAEKAGLVKYIGKLREQIRATIDISQIIRLAGTALAITPLRERKLFPKKRKPTCTRIAVAQDKAFSFYYHYNLELLIAWGAELAYFSPMQDSALPAGTHGVYLGGGFPEIYATQLEANTRMKRALCAAADEGMPIYAECGGLMYLSQGIIDFGGNKYEMVGLLPGWAAMQNRMVRMGYAEAETLRDSILAKRGARLRGHLFHWSKMPQPGARAAYRILDTEKHLEGFIDGPEANILGSYFHLHFGADPSLARRFVASCAEWGRLGMSLQNSGTT
jgi:cobyrinic acid a,c-diamide synthase